MIEIKPLSRYTGALIEGVDLSEPITQINVDAIWRALVEHCVVVVRQQRLSQEQLVRATAQFGACAPYTRPKEHQSRTQRDTLPQIMLISNIREDGKPIGAHPDGEMWFHHDTIHRDVPTKATLLYAVEVPTYGGETVFSNLFAAYEELPADLRDGLAGRRAVNAFAYGSNHRGDPNAVKAMSHAVHPAIRTHEESGRKAIYVDRLMTQFIEDMPAADSAAVLTKVFDHIEDERFLYVHHWQAGDVVMWDNRSSIHARRDFPADQRRLLWRTTVAGDTIPH